MAINNRKPKDGAAVHSDHGSQFTSWAFSERVKGAGLALSRVVSVTHSITQ